MSDAREELRGAFRNVNVAMRRLRGRETHKRNGITFAQFGLLRALDCGGVMSARDLGEAAELSPASVTQMLDALAGAGLVQRTRSREDKRVVLNELTAAGREAIAATQADIDARWAVVFSDFSDEDLRTASAVLERLADHFFGLVHEAESETSARTSG